MYPCPSFVLSVTSVVEKNYTTEITENAEGGKGPFAYIVACDSAYLVFLISEDSFLICRPPMVNNNFIRHKRCIFKYDFYHQGCI